MTSGGRGHTPSTGGKGKEKVDTNRRRRSSTHRPNVGQTFPDTQDSLPVPETQFSSHFVPTSNAHGSGASHFLHGQTSSAIPEDPHQSDAGSGGAALSPGTTQSPSPSSGDDDVVDEEVLTEDGRVRIVPAGSAFLPSKPSSKAITAVIKEKFQRPWTSWGQIKENEDDEAMMLKHFKEKCTWDPCHEELVKKNFHHRAGRRLSDMLVSARKKGIKPHWMGRNVWKALEAHWSTEEYKKMRERNKTNRASEKGGTLHTGGSINTAQIRERMETKLGRPVPLHELHKKVHLRKKTGEYVDQRAREVQENFSQAMSQYLSQAQGTGSTPAQSGDVSEVQLSKWVEVAGGKKKGRVYGAGALASCYRKGISNLDINPSTSSSSAASTGRSYTVEEYAEMQRKVSELQHNWDQSRKGQEVLQEHYGNLQVKVQQMEEQQRQLLELLQQQSVRPMVPPYAQPQGVYYGPPPPHAHSHPQQMPQHSHPQPVHYGGYWPTTPMSQYQQSMQPPSQQELYRPQPVQPQPHIPLQEPHLGQGTTYAQGMGDPFGDMDVSGFINPHPDGQGEDGGNSDEEDYYRNRGGA